MKQRDLKSLQKYAERRVEFLQNLRETVRRILKKQFGLERTTVDRIVSHFFAEGYLPGWYYYHNTAGEIAGHIYVITQVLNANTEFIKLESDDGKSISYFINVGWDYIGKLARIIGEYVHADVVRFDSVMTRSGIRIVSIEKGCRQNIPFSPDEQREASRLHRKLVSFGRVKKIASTELFLQCLPCSYLAEEVKMLTRPRRIYRHLKLFNKALEARGKVVVQTENVPFGADEDTLTAVPEKRLSISVCNPDPLFPLHVLECLADHSINLIRSYFDIFEDTETKTAVAILSVYMSPGIDTRRVAEDVQGIVLPPRDDSAQNAKKLERKLETLLRCFSSQQSTAIEKEYALTELQTLMDENLSEVNGTEEGDFLLNCLTDFFRALRFLDLHSRQEIVSVLLGFDAFEEFFVFSRKAGEPYNLPAFRAKHNSARGPNKGGIRLDPIVHFGEVAALSFMMTWKCARSRILFGGGKGGMVINPKEYNRLDLFDTLSNFGRSLFLITGPAKDIPAGDVGCGPVEIGEMFEGFKSSLRELALMVSGMKKGVALVGNRVVSRKQARTILKKHFDVDVNDQRTVEQLLSSEQYLELVAAAQITGKPRMGLAARTGATGRGLFYAVLAAITNLTLDGVWQPSRPLKKNEIALLKKTAAIGEESIQSRNGRLQISRSDWAELTSTIYPKLLRGKRVVIQGIGKVGRSIAAELAPYGVNIIAAANRSGAVIGEKLDFEDIVAHARTAGNLMNYNHENVRRKLKGAKGADFLILPCDILLPCAMENAITGENVHAVSTGLIACGGNGTNTSKAEMVLEKRGIPVVYDFLANSAGVTASYFEWLRNLHERFRYEAEEIRDEPFDPAIMDRYLMPEFAARIQSILARKESGPTTDTWNLLLRDIMFAAVNDDYHYAAVNGISMKTAGFVDAVCRVLTAVLLKSPPHTRRRLWKDLPLKARTELVRYFNHPEACHHNGEAREIIQKLEPSASR